MTDLYLIAHKVRGEPAFDVAEQIECPECKGLGEFHHGCGCDNGHWWIIPTSGHRAWPYWSVRIDNLADVTFSPDIEWVWHHCTSNVEGWESIPDHYPCNDKVATRKVTEINLEDLDL